MNVTSSHGLRYLEGPSLRVPRDTQKVDSPDVDELGESYHSVAMPETFLCPAPFRALGYGLGDRCKDTLKVALYSAGAFLGGAAVGVASGSLNSPGVGFGIGWAFAFNSGDDAGLGGLLPVVGFTGAGFVAPYVGFANTTAMAVTGGILGAGVAFAVGKETMKSLRALHDAG